MTAVSFWLGFYVGGGFTTLAALMHWLWRKPGFAQWARDVLDAASSPRTSARARADIRRGRK